MKHLLIALSLLSLVAPTAFAQSSDPAWLDALNFQMERDQECEVAYYIKTKEFTLGAQKTYEARLQCIDGRQFDASRIGEDADFTIKRCEVETC